MGNNNIMFLYPKSINKYNQQMLIVPEEISLPLAKEDISVESLRLLSVNEARKILKIRHQTVKELIEEGKIEVIIMGNRTKIPMSSLIKFIKENSHKVSEDEKINRTSVTRDYVCNKIESIIVKHTRRN